MKTTFGHVQFNIDGANAGWYKELFAFLGWETLYEGEGFVGVGNEQGGSLWFMGGASDHVNDHDGPGLNHFALSTGAAADVDATADYLRGKGVELLYGTPCSRPEYESETSAYYSAMFDSPDKILFEVVYNGPK